MTTINATTFKNAAKTSIFGGVLLDLQRAGLDALVAEQAAHWPDINLNALAYIMATAHAETNGALVPVAEVGHGAGKLYGYYLKRSAQVYTDSTQLFYGRGLVQLAWYENYVLASAAAGVDLLADPDLMLTLPVAACALFHGMSAGWFTGATLAQHFDGDAADWLGARDIIRRGDRAQWVADLAVKYRAAIEAAV